MKVLLLASRCMLHTKLEMFYIYLQMLSDEHSLKNMNAHGLIFPALLE